MWRLCTDPGNTMTAHLYALCGCHWVKIFDFLLKKTVTLVGLSGVETESADLHETLLVPL